MKAPHELDAIIIGSSIRGLVTAFVLAKLGRRVALLERGPRAGGVDSSFVTPAGHSFEHGMHVLDFMRSELTTRLFTAAVDGEVHRTTLRRAIALRGELMPYAPTREQLPEALRALLPEGPLVDDIGDELPTRARIAACYGQPFADLIFDEVLPSFPTEHRHAKLGVDEAHLLANIYPWFFPRARRKGRTGDASRAFHDRLRDGVPQEILYPRQGGFGGFAQGFVRKLTALGVEIVTGAEDLRVELEPGSHRVRMVRAGGRDYRAARYYWAGSWPVLCKLLGLPCQEVATDRVLVGSFCFDRAALGPYQEILVGDPRLALGRVSFPARFRESDDPLLQVEYAVPLAEEPTLDADGWRDRWLTDLRALGVLDESHRVEEFVLKSFAMHFNAYGMEGVALRDADPGLIDADSNLSAVAPSMANWNLNTHVPMTVAQVLADCGFDDEAQVLQELAPPLAAE